MARSKHTSGMWETIDHNETPTIIANMDGWMEDGRMHYAYDVIAQCCDEHGDVLPNANANARLIAAAPELLVALADIISSSDANCGDSLANAIDAARHIVAKAKGGMDCDVEEIVTSAEIGD